MAERIDPHAALGVVQRAAVGAPVEDDELERALAHVAMCPICGTRFDVGASPACDDVEGDLPLAAAAVADGGDLASRYPALAAHLQTCERCRQILDELVNEPDRGAPAELRLEPGMLFEVALTGALSDPDPTVRLRAAGRLGGFGGLGVPGIAALVDTAGRDADETVRAAALMALDRLDADVSFPQRVVDAWARTPADAAGYLESVLSRLANPQPPTTPRVTELTAATTGAAGPIELIGTGGATGELTDERRELWLALRRLPSIFERGRPLVAVPRALELPAPVTWPGAHPGLVRARRPVVDGELRMPLGNMLEGRPPDGALPADVAPLFDRFYLLDPTANR